MKNERLLWAVVISIALISASNFINNQLLLQKLSGLQGAPYTLSEISVDPREFENYVREKSLPIVAVSSEGKGIIGIFKVMLIPGNNNVLVNTNPFLETDIQYSANKAVTVAKLSSDYGYDKDFLLDFAAGDAKLIGGESAGAAMTIATIAALQDKEITGDAVITGTINPDGTIGQIGGVFEKAKAVSDAGYRYFLIPQGQSKLTYYEQVTVRQPTVWGRDVLRTTYVPKSVDLVRYASDEWGLSVVEVADISEALPYLLEE